MVGGSLSDVIVYDCAGRAQWYVEDIPEDLVHERHKGLPRITWSYSDKREGIGLQLHVTNAGSALCGLRSKSNGVFSQFIHPVLQYFPPGVAPTGRQPAVMCTMMLSRAEQRAVTRAPYAILANQAEHPSSSWERTRGVSRLHIKESYTWLDWTDSGVRQAMAFFLAHADHAAARWCAGGGSGAIGRPFDEGTDTRLYESAFGQTIVEAAQRMCGDHSWAPRTALRDH
eukprot:gene6282-4198_t